MNLLGYNYATNTDVFYKDVPDGVNVIEFGSIMKCNDSKPLAIVGGNCSSKWTDFTQSAIFFVQ